MSVATYPKTFRNIVDIVERRGRIKGDVKEDDRDLVKGYINQHYMSIATERNWKWRAFDRSFIMGPAIALGTVAVTNGSREAVFTGLTISNIHLGRSLRITGDMELYRIIGVNTVSNSVYLEANYVGTTNALATYKMYKYEFALPPDLDTINNLYTSFEYGYGGGIGQIDERSLPEFNRLVAGNSTYIDLPIFYCRDGRAYVNPDLPKLNEIILNYDFLGGADEDQSDRIRIFPLETDKERLIHLNYSKIVDPLQTDDQEPLIPYDDRWVLVDLTLSDWSRDNGRMIEAGAQKKSGTQRLKEMRSEHRKGDTPPKVIIMGSMFKRVHFYENDREDLFRISRALEY